MTCVKYNPKIVVDLTAFIPYDYWSAIMLVDYENIENVNESQNL